MSLALQLVWWSAVALILYTYGLFPVLVFLRGRLQRRPYRAQPITPSVSMVVAAHNEAGSIRAKLENVLALNYPREALEIIVGSDGSTDDMNAIVRSFADRGVKLLDLPRQGKIAALNAAVAASTGEILVFSDANSMFGPESLRALVSPFADPEVGGVAGDQRYQPQSDFQAGGEGEMSYWNFDRRLKRSQSEAGNAISATGAIYAIRRSLYSPVPSGVMDDFVISTRVIAQGYRLVFAPAAVAFEPVAGSDHKEFKRKVRNITLGLHGVLTMRMLLNPFRHGFYALQLLSHKVLRRLMVLPLMVLLVTSPLLWSSGWIYQAASLGQAGLYGCAVLGWLLRNTRLGRLKFLALPLYFCLVNIAALLAVRNVLRGQRIHVWEPTSAGVHPGALPTEAAGGKRP